MGARIPPQGNDGFRINSLIRAPIVRLVDQKGKLLGQKTIFQALQIARQRGYDLVEVAPDARPPVCKLLRMDEYKKHP